MAVIKKRDKKGKITKVDNSNQSVFITGRKTIMTQDVVGKLEYAFSIGSTVGEACAFAEINRDTFYEFIKKHPEFADRVKDLKNKPILEARACLVRNAKTNPLWAFKYLERKRPKEFGANLKLTDGEGKPIPIEGQVVNNNLNLFLENADPNTRKQWIDASRKLLTGANPSDDLPLQSASSD